MPSSSASAITRIPASGVRRSWETHDDELAPRLLEPLLALARLGQAPVGGRELGGEGLELGRPAALGDELPPAPTRRTSSRSDCDHRTSAAASASATASDTTAAAVVTISTTERSWSEISIRREIACTPSRTVRVVTTATTASCQRSDRWRRAQPASRPSRPTATPLTIATTQISVRSLMRWPPTGSRRPRP